MLIVFLLMFMDKLCALDFRSQAFKSINSLPSVLPQQNTPTIYGNPYIQFGEPTSTETAQFKVPTTFNTKILPENIFQQMSRNFSYQNHHPIPSFPITHLLPENFNSLENYTTDVKLPPNSLLQNVTAVAPSKKKELMLQKIEQSVLLEYSTTPTSTATQTPLVWTTTRFTKTSARMSKLSMKPFKKDDSGGAAQVSVPSHRLLNDILVIPSSRRLYILAIIPIHESADSKGFECGHVDVNGFIRLAAFLDALKQVNSQRILQDASLSLGAVIIDSCSSDLRTVADLYELLSGTNIQKADLVALVRDDESYLPNVDEFSRHLKIPVINTFFASKQNPLTTGMLPSVSSTLEAMIGLLKHTESNCVSLLYDDLHKESALLLLEISSQRGVCLEQRLKLGGVGEEHAEDAVRRLLLTEARVVIVLLGEGNWINLIKAFKNEMVIGGRFILLTVQDSRWSTSKQFLEAWPHFDQLLLTVTAHKPSQQEQLSQLTSKFPKFPFPQHWLRQFWATAFKCHIEGEKISGEQFSKECSHKQSLNLTSVAPDIDIAPLSLAVHTVAHAMRKLVDNVCPGALVQSLNDCLNDPQESLYGSLLSLQFSHTLSDEAISFNETSGYRDISLRINRVIFDAQLEFDQIAEWSTILGFSYTAISDLIMEERDGSRVPLKSTCPKSTCASDLVRRSQFRTKPTFRMALNSVTLLIYTICAVLAFFVCLMCMYHQIVAEKSNPYRICTTFTFGGLGMLCLVSILFVMPPNAISCAGRRTTFSIALSAVFGPILVKTISIWRSDLAMQRGSLRSLIIKNSNVMFWTCLGITVIQCVISTEWAIFESVSDMSFVSSLRHGHAWRCSPGEKFEQRVFHSCVLSGLMILISLVCSTLSVRNVESRQNILISVIAIIFAVPMYISLPLLPYHLRDHVVAGALLLFSFLTLFISYCHHVFYRSDGDSTDGSLVEKGTIERSEKSLFWQEQSILPLRQVNTLSLQRNYHQAATLPQKISTMEKQNSHGFSASKKAVVAYNGPQKYEIESYGSPTTHQISVKHLNLNLSANTYGKEEFVVEENDDHAKL